MQHANEGLRCPEASAFRPPALRRVCPRRGGSLRPHATLSQVPLTVATTRGLATALNGGLAKWQWPAVLATASQLLGHPAVAGLPPALGQQPGQAAWMTMASLFTLAASMSGVLYCMARTVWEGLEPYVFQQDSRGAQAPLLLHGVDVSGSRFFARPAVRAAADFAAAAHAGQMRKTRQPYVTHCLETALIVEGLLSPTEEDERAEAAVIAALLHDVLDDTEVEAGEVEELFGEQVASMVAKVSQLSTTNQIVRRRLRVESAQPTAEEEAQLRTMILTMVGEPLVIAIKLADRLHNMRTVYALSLEKQVAVAEETRRVWCSLAERLGMFALKSELEDLCFAVLQPRDYSALRRQLDELWGVTTIHDQAASAGAGLSMDSFDCTVEADGSLHLTAKRSRGAAPPVSAAEAASAAADAVLRESRTMRAAAGTSAAVASRGPSGGGVDVGEDEDEDEELDWLTHEQRETKRLVDSVLPFDATTFNIAKLRSGAGARRGLEVLQACAQLLMREIGTESLASGLEVSVQGRLKSLYSTHRKMRRKEVPLAQVYDARALRVIVDDEGGRRQAEAIAACYKLLPAVHRLFRRVHGEEDDYIAQPKPSGYQSLHTAVVGPGGVPLEVQMRTSSMHSDAEYGKAAHWAYKEKPALPPPPPQHQSLAASSGSSSSSEDEAAAAEGDGGGIVAGQPVLHIGPGGRLCDGVVVQSQFGGRRLLCAVSKQQRAAPDARPSPAEEYSRLLRYVEERGFFQPSQGDIAVALELFTLCSDGKYHRLDRFGHKLPTVVVPLAVEEEQREQQTAESATAEPAPEHGRAGRAAAEGEMDYMNNRIRLLRSMLEWGRELGASIAAESALAEEAAAGSDAAAIAAWTEAQLAPRAAGAGVGADPDVMVVVWPGGRILRVPRGTTAGSVIRTLGLIEIQQLPSSSRDGADVAPASPEQLVNVNNRLVPEETPLFDGDYVVLSRDRVKI